jgi:hypothetical protein
MISDKVLLSMVAKLWMLWIKRNEMTDNWKNNAQDVTVKRVNKAYMGINYQILGR